MKYAMCLMMFLMAGGSLAMADDASAGHGKGNGQALEKRVERQHNRINRLEKNGKIDAAEAATLNKNVDGVSAKIEEAKKDGVTQDERKELRKELRASSEEIKKARKSKK